MMTSSIWGCSRIQCL